MRPPVGQRRADGQQTRPRSVFEKEARGPAIPAAGGFPGKRKNPDVLSTSELPGGGAIQTRTGE